MKKVHNAPIHEKIQSIYTLDYTVENVLKNVGDNVIINNYLF